MAVTYEPIASTTVSGTPTEITFSDIPGTHTDLICVYHLTADTDRDVYVRFNSDTGSNYSATILHGNGTAAGSYRQSGASAGILLDYYGSAGTAYVTNVMHIMSYANTNVYKTVLSAPGRAANGVDRAVGLWRSTSAITSLTLRVVSGNFAAGSVALYGIKAA